MHINFKEAKPANFGRGRTGYIQYIVIHYTANDGDTAAGNAGYFERTETQTSAHYFVDENPDIWQSVRDEDTAWHCGTSAAYKHPVCRNNNSIGIELCSRKDAFSRYFFKDETVKNAAALTRMLMNKYVIPVENIMRHYDVTGKCCPAPFVEDGSLWRGFLEQLNPETAQKASSMVRFDLFGQRVANIGGLNDNGTIYVAARELLEAMDFLVHWNDYEKTVLVRSKTAIAVSGEERFILEKIVEAEAGGEDNTGKILVTNVILNRVKSVGFPNSIKDVVFQPHQFEPIQKETYSQASPSKSTINAVQYALRGADYSQGALYFRSIAGATEDCWHEKALIRVLDHGGHRFYK